MGKSHSQDILERVVAMVEAGHSCRSATRCFVIGDSTTIRVMQRRRKTGSVSPPRQGRPPGSGKLAAYLSFLVAQVELKSNVTMPELGRQTLRDACRSDSPFVVVAYPCGGRLHI